MVEQQENDLSVGSEEDKKVIFFFFFAGKTLLLISFLMGAFWHSTAPLRAAADWDAQLSSGLLWPPRSFPESTAGGSVKRGCQYDEQAELNSPTITLILIQSDLQLILFYSPLCHRAGCNRDEDSSCILLPLTCNQKPQHKLT